MPECSGIRSACVAALGGNVSTDIQTRTQSVFDELAARQTWKIKHVIYIVLGAVFLAWCADGVNLRPREVFNAAPVIADYFARMVPPKWSFIEVIWKPAVETDRKSTRLNSSH